MDSLSKSIASADSGEGSVSGEGYGVSVAASFGFSTEQSSALASVTSLATSMSSDRHVEKTTERTYQPGVFQIFRKLAISITVDGQTAKEVDDEIINVVSSSNALTFDDLHKLDESYIQRHYGVKNRPGTYYDKKCKTVKEIIYRTPTQTGACFIRKRDEWQDHEKCHSSNNPLSVCRAHCDSDILCKGYVKHVNGCQLATTSDCPLGFVKYGRGKPDRVGDLVPDGGTPSSTYGGCFIKTANHHFVNM